MNTVSYKDFSKLDIRIGTVVRAEVPVWSHWVMKLTVDVGNLSTDDGLQTTDLVQDQVQVQEEGKIQTTAKQEKAKTLTVFAGIMKFYKPEDLEGKQFPFIVNLEPKKIGPEGDVSEGMMIMCVISDDEETKPILLEPQERVANGTRVM